MVTDPLATLLADYLPKTGVEAHDLDRIRTLVQRGNAWRREQPLHVTASALVVHPASERVLLRWHERQQAWLQVGGHGDPGETDPVAVACREGFEETGLTDLRPWPTAELQHLVIVPVPPRADEPAHHHADLRFLLATDEPERARPEQPTAPLDWLSLADALQRTTEENLRETITRAAAVLGWTHAPRR